MFIIIIAFNTMLTILLGIILTILITIQDILEEADTDKNGLIDYAEFANMMEPGRRFSGLQ